jgi:hypothetical protein
MITTSIKLLKKEVLYELCMRPGYQGDDGLGTSPSVELTMDNEYKLWDGGELTQPYTGGHESPSKLGICRCRMLWTCFMRNRDTWRGLLQPSDETDKRN